MHPDRGSQELGASNSVLGSSSVEGTAFCPRKPQSSILSKVAEKARDQAEQDGYDAGIVETKEALRAEVSRVCRTYCLQV